MPNLTHHMNDGLVSVPSRHRSLSTSPSFTTRNIEERPNPTLYFHCLHLISDPLSSTPEAISHLSLAQRNWWWWMAKNNKYTSINFNHIYDKTTRTSANTNLAKNPTPFPSSSYSAASYSAISAPNKAHGRMLVLTRPAPKPVQSHPQQPPQQQSKLTQQVADQPLSESGSDAISLRPLGRTGIGSSLSSPVSNYDKDQELPPAPPVISPKPDKFVPPHLRPGFVPREEKPGPELGRAHRLQVHAGSPGRYAENGRPKSGGYERMRRVGVSDMGMMNRPRSSGSRPSSSG